MISINCLGDNLNVIINGNYNISHEWMAFACWYSINKNLPDAKVELVISSAGAVSRQLFDWTGRVGVRLHLNKHVELKPNSLAVPACSMAVRDLPQGAVDLLNDKSITIMNEEKGLCCEAKEDCFVPFVTYLEGVGNFVTGDWINKDECPFPWADRFMSHSANANEIRILKLWKQLSQIFTTVSRG